MRELKRFLVFAGSDYYPSGGWDDFIGSADTKEEALVLVARYARDWSHIIDGWTGARI